MTLGEKILKLRKARNLSQEQLAQALEVSRQAVSKWELNEAVPDVARVVAMSELFGVTTDYLLKAGAAEETGKEEGTTGAAAQRDKKWLGAVLVAVSALTIFGMWAVVEITGRNYYSDSFFQGTGLLAYITASGVRMLLFCVLLVCLIGGVRLLLGKPFWFQRPGSRAFQETAGGDGIYSQETLRLLREEESEQNADRSDRKE